MDLDFDIVFRNLPVLLTATVITLKISVVAFIGALALAFMVGAIRSSNRTGFITAILAAYVEIFRGTPLLIQLFFIYYGLPAVGIVMDSFTAGVLGLALNGGAYMSEVVRASISAIEKGQEEASLSLGFSRFQTMWYIILPQALRVAIPALMNSFSSMLKESSLVSVISITELTRTGNIIYSRTTRPFEIYLALGFFYFVMTYTVSIISRRLETKASRWR